MAISIDGGVLTGDARLIADLRQIVQRFDLSSLELAALCGFTEPTARLVRIGGILPEKRRCREGLRAFVDRARRAKRREELTLPPRVTS